MKNYHLLFYRTLLLQKDRKFIYFTAEHHADYIYKNINADI